MTLRGPHRRQLNDPDASAFCEVRNCVPWCFSMAAYRDSVGRFDFTATQIRNKAGVSCSTGTGGVGYLAGATAVKSLTSGYVKLEVANVTPSELYHEVLGGRGAIISVSYKELLGRDCACDGDFQGGHAIFANEARNKDGVLQYIDGDPLCDGRGSYPNGWQWVNASLIHRAGLARTGGNGINVVLTQDTERVRRYSSNDVPVYARPRLDSVRLGKTRANTEYFVQATVTGSPWAPGRWGWHRIPFGKDRVGYVRGKDLW